MSFKSEPCANFIVATNDRSLEFDDELIVSQETLLESDGRGKCVLIKLKYPTVMEQAKAIFEGGFPYPIKLPAIFKRYGIREHKYITQCWAMLKAAADSGDFIDQNQTSFPKQYTSKPQFVTKDKSSKAKASGDHGSAGKKRRSPSPAASD